MPSFPEAPQVLLPLYIAYLEAYGVPRGREQAACAAALETAFHSLSGRKVSERVIARKSGVSVRLMRVFVHRLMRIAHRTEKRESAGE